MMKFLRDFYHSLIFTLTIGNDTIDHGNSCQPANRLLKQAGRVWSRTSRASREQSGDKRVPTRFATEFFISRETARPRWESFLQLFRERSYKS